MGHCNHVEVFELVFGEYGELGVIFTLFLNGFIGSFVHCIPMCGSIALSISNARLMHLKSSELTERAKLRYIFATPYYLGKSITYVAIGSSFFLFKSALQDLLIAKIFGFALLVIAAISFIMMGISGSVNLNLLSRPLFKKIETVVLKLSKRYFSFFGFKGLLYGLILGVIPCGLVYTSIITVATYATNLLTVMVALMAFGMATIPGLFLTSYFGNILMSRRGAQLMKFLYGILMIVNSYLLISYALKLL